jgi:hypothetical protein
MDDDTGTRSMSGAFAITASTSPKYSQDTHLPRPTRQTLTCCRNGTCPHAHARRGPASAAASISQQQRRMPRHPRFLPTQTNERKGQKSARTNTCSSRSCRALSCAAWIIQRQLSARKTQGTRHSYPSLFERTVLEVEFFLLRQLLPNARHATWLKSRPKLGLR